MVVIDHRLRLIVGNSKQFGMEGFLSLCKRGIPSFHVLNQKILIYFISKQMDRKGDQIWFKRTQIVSCYIQYKYNIAHILIDNN